MNTFELNDELLNRALAVRSQAVPAGLNARVRRAIDIAGRPGGAAGSWWVGSSALRRPVLRGAMWFALLAGLLVVVMIGTLFYVGSLPPTSTASPTPSPAPSATPTLTVPPTAPPSTPTPRPIVNAAEFADHIASAINSFGPAADGLYWFVKSLDYSSPGPDALDHVWIPAEVRWLSEHEPRVCLELRWDAWRDAIRALEAVTPGMLPFGGTSEDEFTRFAAARETIESFDPLEGTGTDC